MHRSVEEGCTIPFISRYRKEKHDNLDEVQVRDCDHLYKSYHNLEDRRLEIVKGVFAQGKLTETLYNAIMSATTMTALEDLWAPFKKKKKTRGMVAAASTNPTDIDTIKAQSPILQSRIEPILFC